jgi:hypothetical protein
MSIIDKCIGKVLVDVQGHQAYQSTVSSVPPNLAGRDL